MKVELRNVKHAAFASEETSSFEATVYIDGKKAGTVHNDGHGGPDMHDPFDLHAKLEAWAKTLPPYELGGEKHPHSAETAVGDLFDAWMLARNLRRLTAKSVVYVGTDGKLYTVKPRDKAQLPRAIVEVAKRPVVKCVLNTMPESEALVIFKQAAS